MVLAPGRSQHPVDLGPTLSTRSRVEDAWTSTGLVAPVDVLQGCHRKESGTGGPGEPGGLVAAFQRAARHRDVQSNRPARRLQFGKVTLTARSSDRGRSAVPCCSAPGRARGENGPRLPIRPEAHLAPNGPEGPPRRTTSRDSNTPTRPDRTARRQVVLASAVRAALEGRTMSSLLRRRSEMAVALSAAPRCKVWENPREKYPGS